MNFKKYLALGTALTLTLLAGCGSSGSGDDQIVIYSNADEEAITAMENALDAGGYEGKYIVQTYGTSELGGKLLAEGTNLEADLVTMSTFYLQSAQEQNNMFLPLDFEVNTLEEVPDYTAPITSQEGAIILNTELMASENLPTPTCLKDLADPVYAGQVAVTDIQSSSTAWLLIQALVDAYGEDGAEETLAAIYDNCGAHIETSGSGPLKLCRAGEVAIGFGLRHQAVADKADGLPIDYVDPTEGKLLAEGTNLEADLVTMSTFYLQSAQEQNNMFLPLDFEVNTLEEVPDYTAPITSQEGAIILNTELMASENLPTPTCLKDLADPVYAGQVAVTDIQSSSTAWLLIQALVDAYGEDGAEETLAAIYDNCGAHIETSGSGPLKLCRAGEVAIGFGLRHQAVADKADGLPIDYVDPTEGNFSLTESVAVLDKGEDTNPLAMEMARCIIENGRAELIQTYPNPLYEGETADPANQSDYPSIFDEPLTFELFTAHQELSERAKG